MKYIYKKKWQMHGAAYNTGTDHSNAQGARSCRASSGGKNVTKPASACCRHPLPRVHLLLWEQLLQLLHQWALGYSSGPHTGAKWDAALLPIWTSNGDATVFHFDNFAVQHELSACKITKVTVSCVT
jgi:hypothetical protein